MKITFSKISTKELATLTKRVITSSKGGNYKMIEEHQLLLEVEKHYEDYNKVYSKLT